MNLSTSSSSSSSSAAAAAATSAAGNGRTLLLEDFDFRPPLPKPQTLQPSSSCSIDYYSASRFASRMPSSAPSLSSSSSAAAAATAATTTARETAATASQLRRDEDIARLLQCAEAQRIQEEQWTRCRTEMESLHVATAIQAAEIEEARERRKKESEEAEILGWEAAMALLDDEERGRMERDWEREQEREREREKEELERAELEWVYAGSAGAARVYDCDDDDAVDFTFLASAKSTPAAASVALSTGAAGGTAAIEIDDDDDDDLGESDAIDVSVDDFVAAPDDGDVIRMALAIQDAEEELALRRRQDEAASLELARALHESEETEEAMRRRSSVYETRRNESRFSDGVASFHAPSSSAPAALSSPPTGNLVAAESAHRGGAYYGHVPIHAGMEEARSRLTLCQRKAMGYVNRIAQELHNNAMPALRSRILALGYSIDDLNTCLAYIRDDAPIIIHLKESTLQHLCHDPWYRSQFETGMSGGTLDRCRRQKWEDAMFGAAYRNAPDADRPKYGCLNITGDILGVRGARGYGKFYLTLASGVRYRTSFSNKDTGQQGGQSKLATNKWYGHVLAEYSDDELRTVFRVSGVSRLMGAPSTAFAQYKECQMHGTLSMETDVLALSVPMRRAKASTELADLVENFRVISGCTILWQGDLIDDD